MKKYRLYQVDAFTKEKFHGNPAGVVPHADGLTEEKVLVHGRMFAPASGILEDPVTGNANGPLGVYLVHFGLCKHLQNKDYFEFEIKQGEAIKRDGGMKVHVQKVGGKPHLVQITGRAVIAFQTEIQIEE